MFNARKAQFERRFKKWGFRKNSTSAEWTVILSHVKRRQRLGKDTHLYIDGKLIADAKIKKEETRRLRSINRVGEFRALVSYVLRD